MAVLIFLPILSLLVGDYGSKREIGFWWTFFFSLFFSPIAGWAIASGVPKINGEIITEKPTIWNKLFAVIFLALGLFLVSYATYLLSNSSNNLFGQEKITSNLFLLGFGIGFLGSALYVSRIRRFRYMGERRIVSNSVEPAYIDKPKTNEYDYHNIIYWVMSFILASLLVIVIIKKGV